MIPNVHDLLDGLFVAFSYLLDINEGIVVDLRGTKFFVQKDQRGVSAGEFRHNIPGGSIFHIHENEIDALTYSLNENEKLVEKTNITYKEPETIDDKLGAHSGSENFSG